MDLPLPVSINRIWHYPKGAILENLATDDIDLSNDEMLDNINESAIESYESDDDENEHNQPDVINEPDDDDSGWYVSSQQTEKTDSSVSLASQPNLTEVAKSSSIPATRSSAKTKQPSLTHVADKNSIREIPILRKRKARRVVYDRAIPKRKTKSN